MYCVNCGVRLADTEKSCPLCGTAVYHPDIKQEKVRPLYPRNRTARIQANLRARNGILIVLFLIPVLICLLSDLHADKTLNWFGFAAGGILVGYTVFALPLWFRRKNPAIFVPCDFAAAALYLLYICLVTGGEWYLPFALPVAGALCLIVSAVAILLHYLPRARLYILGGGLIALGALALAIEILLGVAFRMAFVGWSVYPLTVLALLGGGLIFLAINSTAREMMERRLFF